MTTAPKRHPALLDLSRDHQQFLNAARQIRGALDESEDDPAFDAMLRSLLDFWNQEGLLHIRQEEEILLPMAFPETISSQPYVIRVVGDHMWLRDRISRIEAQMDSTIDRKLLRAISERFSEHVRFEERVLFEFIQKNLTESELDAILEHANAFRQKWRPV